MAACGVLAGGHYISQPQCGHTVHLAGFFPGKAMLKKSLYRQTLVLGLFLLSGCELTQGAQRDFNRLVHGNPFQSSTSGRSTHSQAYTSSRQSNTVAAAKTTNSKPDDSMADPQQAAASTPAPSIPAAPVTLVGKSEGQVRAMLGPPTSVEERAPGKTWHYRDGRCSVDVQLYPDVQTRQFGTLAYEVKSDDNSDEGKRDCLARLRSRAQ
jgi:hypothetical protein